MSAQSNAKHWFVMTKQGKRGPFSSTALKRLAWQGHIHRPTKVRLNDGEWMDAGRVVGLWDVRWKKPTSKSETDNPTPAHATDSSCQSAGVSALWSMLRAAKSSLVKSCVYARCSVSGNTTQ